MGLWNPHETQNGKEVGRVNTPSILVLEMETDLPDEGEDPENLDDFTESLGDPGHCQCGSPAEFRCLLFNINKRLISDSDSCISCSRDWDNEHVPYAWKSGRYQIIVSQEEEDIYHALELAIVVGEVMAM